MKNRDRLRQTNIYDLLMDIFKFAGICPIYAVSGKAKSGCLVLKGWVREPQEKCVGCIQNWLNEEENT